MKSINRRDALFSAAGTFILSSVADARLPGAQTQEKGKNTVSDMPLGIISKISDPDTDIAYVRKRGFGTCQMIVDDYSEQHAKNIKDSLQKHDVKPTSLICMGPGPYKWNFYEGPSTIGLIPRRYRAERIERLKTGIEFCRISGIPAVLAHFGFIPEDPNDILYGEFIEIMKDIAEYALNPTVEIHFETGQETPVTLLRAIEDIGFNNLGINYDTANLILYGKANPVDGLDVVGRHVKSLHAKDGFYPTNPRELGKEVPIGEGKVDFPGVIRKLKKLGFKGHITIEREISGSRQIEDILKAKAYLESLIAST